MTIKSWSLLFVICLVFLVGCTGNELDDGDSSGVLFEVQSVDNEPIGCQQSGGGFEFEITEWEVTFNSISLADVGEGAPALDVILDDVVLSYSWIDGVATTPTRVVGLAQVAVSTDGTNTVNFSPMNIQDIASLATQLGGNGATADVTMLFRGNTAEGEAVTILGAEQLFFEGCTAP